MSNPQRELAEEIDDLLSAGSQRPEVRRWFLEQLTRTVEVANTEMIRYTTEDWATHLALVVMHFRDGVLHFCEPMIPAGKHAIVESEFGGDYQLVTEIRRMWEACLEHLYSKRKDTDGRATEEEGPPPAGDGEARRAAPGPG